ncbi:helix-turn-helix domain-containing protein [Streptomyces sp. NPDC091377]|uniref:helix-turn-helix domain-containing protein n=1 Tax=Streptomyces sp. NPDC091377 TaxID=3365995 RepID=UPI0037F1D597
MSYLETHIHSKSRGCEDASITSSSRSDVCGRSGIDIATYSRIEQGHSSPLLDTLIRIADANGVPPADPVR